MPRTLFAIVILLLLSPLTRGQTTQPATQPSAPRPRVMIISVDGLRPDLLLRCRTPNMRSLMDSGSYSCWARTVPHSITLPSHVSMLTGVVPRKHKIEWNDDLPLSKPVYPAFPTLFNVAKKAGYTTALAAGKMKFGAMCEPGTVDWQSLPTKYECEDEDVVRDATRMIASHRPEVMAIHLPTVDSVGHAKGWGTKEQVVAIEQADGHVGSILKALDDAKLRDATFIILTADHGGAGMTHLADDPRARFIPWVITGPGIRKGIDLTFYPQLVINTEDTFATACKLLHIPLDPRIDGKPVVPIFDALRLATRRFRRLRTHLSDLTESLLRARTDLDHVSPASDDPDDGLEFTGGPDFFDDACIYDRVDDATAQWLLNDWIDEAAASNRSSVGWPVHLELMKLLAKRGHVIRDRIQPIIRSLAMTDSIHDTTGLWTRHWIHVSYVCRMPDADALIPRLLKYAGDDDRDALLLACYRLNTPAVYEAVKSNIRVREAEGWYPWSTGELGQVLELLDLWDRTFPTAGHADIRRIVDAKLESES